ncbi:MAG: hypothetical protein PWP64_138 [Candidatus Cloacimonadota bacterium]|nr:hypothetical protein [Candidatus Cloacimonadota bacterium]
MSKTLIVILILISVNILCADELDDKVRELQRLQSELESTEAKAQETAARLQQTVSEIQRTSSLKQLSEKNLKKYKAEARTLRDSLTHVERQIELAAERLEHLHRVQNAQIQLLLRVDRSYKGQQIQHRDHHYLQELIKLNCTEIAVMGGHKVSLERAQQLTSTMSTKINRNLRNEDQQARRYATQIRSLDNQSKELSKAEQELRDRIAQLTKDAAELETLISRLMEESGRLPSSYRFTQAKIAWPVRGTIIRNFGQETRDYNTSVVSNGIDIAVREGSNVVAIDDGEVVFSDRYGGQGKMIIIDHKNGFFSLYGYNSDLLVSRGASVTRGQVIARSGMTGSAAEPSLHFELRKDGVAINPLPFFEAR